MASNEKQIRETARCVRTLLKTRGQSITLKELLPLVESADLTDPVALTQQISQDLSNRPATVATTDRTATPKVRKTDVVKDWFVTNYDFIHQCPEVEDFILANVTRGRVPKEEQERRRAALIARATGAEDTEVIEETAPETTEETAPAPTSEYNF